MHMPLKKLSVCGIDALWLKGVFKIIFGKIYRFSTEPTMDVIDPAEPSTRSPEGLGSLPPTALWAQVYSGTNPMVQEEGTPFAQPCSQWPTVHTL